MNNKLLLDEFKNYKISVEALHKILNSLIDRNERDGVNQNFSCNSEITEIAERIKFISYKLYFLQNYNKEK